MFSRLKYLLFTNTSTKQTLVKNTLWLMTAEAVAKFFLFVITISVIRYLGPDEYGKYSFAVAFAAVFGVIADFGLGTMLLQELTSRANKNAPEVFGSVLTMRGILASIAFVLVYAFSLLFHITPHVRTLVILAGLYTAIQSLVLLFPFLFQAYETMQYSFIIRVGSNIILAVFVLSAIVLRLPVDAIFYAYIFTALSMVLTAFLLVRYRLFLPKLTLDTQAVIYFLKGSWPLFLGNVCLTLYTLLDTTLLGLLRGYREAGIYQSAYKILYVFQTLNLIHTALYPRMADLYRTNTAGLKKLLFLCISVSLAVLLPTVIAITILRFQIVSLVYGKGFEQSANVMTLLIAGGAIGFLSGYFSNLLLVKRKQKQWFFALLISLAVNVSVNLLAISRMGPVGAGFAYIAGYMILLAVQIIIYCEL
jgi:O-antigen/teichoic acid export membrane protein